MVKRHYYFYYKKLIFRVLKICLAKILLKFKELMTKSLEKNSRFKWMKVCYK